MGRTDEGELVFGWSFASEVYGGANFDAALAEWDALADDAKAFALERTIAEMVERYGARAKHVSCWRPLCIGFVTVRTGPPSPSMRPCGDTFAK